LLVARSTAGRVNSLPALSVTEISSRPVHPTEDPGLESSELSVIKGTDAKLKQKEDFHDPLVMLGGSPTMSKREPKYKQKSSEPDRYWLRKTDFEKFGADVIRLTDITKNKKTFEGLAVILDLQDFTIFCDQRDPQHQVPRFLGLFIRWLFQRIRTELFDRNDGDEVVLWSHLPIFSKFLGDGVLLIWDVSDVSLEARRNIVQACEDQRKLIPRKQALTSRGKLS
jgi:hypothetical protein